MALAAPRDRPAEPRRRKGHGDLKKGCRMSQRLQWILAVVLGAVGAAPALSAAREARRSAGSTDRAIVVPPLQFTDRTLANGLRVLLVEDHSTPLAAISVGYHVGGKDDPPGRSGFAHLFEHLMFKGTANTPPEMMDRLTEDVGGYNNAFTVEDATIDYEVVPSNYLDSLIWAEA